MDGLRRVAEDTQKKQTEEVISIDTQVDIFDLLEPSTPKPLNNILKVCISTPIALGEYKRQTSVFKTIEEKEEYLSTLDIFSRRTSRTGNLEYVVINVDLWK